MFKADKGDRILNHNVVLILNDGKVSGNLDAANAAKAAGIEIILVAVGADLGGDLGGDTGGDLGGESEEGDLAEGGSGGNINLNLLRNTVSNPDTDLHITNDFCSVNQYLRQRFSCGSVAADLENHIFY